MGRAGVGGGSNTGAATASVPTMVSATVPPGAARRGRCAMAEPPASVELGAVLAREQGFDGAPRLQVFVQDAEHRFADRHVDAECATEHAHIARRRDAFGHVSKLA